MQICHILGTHCYIARIIIQVNDPQTRGEIYKVIRNVHTLWLSDFLKMLLCTIILEDFNTFKCSTVEGSMIKNSHDN